MTDAVLIITSTVSREDAERVAMVLVGEGLAACGQILPATSIYRWEDRVERAEELVLHIKTLAGRAAAVERRICEVHSYAVPEVIVLPITGGSNDYLAWIAAEASGLS
ncbi:divalent cation tolerance protein [Sphingomonas sp. YR710]|uniref:divalent-cation tolerance protein CutA n=1 Tax=Sphingomonas sp. YR710 TaxID=1882773 RepID=UPI0008911F1C|nr:divalent-cation tolerance protein CutA [Sphingomonas sp. YR710]SDC02574.1 divalent cation tolerance protein [Sphingomonas sp. YR710]